MPQRLRPLIEPLAGVVFLLLWIQAEIGRAHPTGFWIGLGLFSVAVGLSRLVPLAAVAIVTVVPLLQLAGILSPPEATTWPIWFAALAVAFAAGNSPHVVTRWFGLAAGAVSAGGYGLVLVAVGDWRSWTGVAGAGTGSDLGVAPSALLFAVVLAATGFLLWVAAWAVGFAGELGGRRRFERELVHDAERERVAADAERRSEVERGEIAREVHDVLAHSLAVVTAVADGARYLREAKPDTPAGRTDDALREIAGTARSALVDLRGLLEGLGDGTRDTARGEGQQPRPALGDLGALVDRVRSTGMRVQLEHVGTPRPLTPSQELSVYRIVQESLTNALKHGGEHPAAAVSLAWEGSSLVLTVVSTGDRSVTGIASSGTGADGGADSGADPGAGRVRRFGIRGMKDRAHLAGGWLTAGPEADGDFVVTASIPTPGLVAEDAA